MTKLHSLILKKLLFIPLLAGILCSGWQAGYSQTLPTEKKPAKKEAGSKVSKTKTGKTKVTKKPATGTEVSPASKPVVESKKPENQSKPVIASGTAPSGEEYGPIIEKLPEGQIDWTNQYIEALGQSVIDTVRFRNKAQAKAMARRGAIVDAQRNLLEIIKGVDVTSETRVQDLITQSDFILTRVDGVVKNAQIEGEAIDNDGLMEIRLRIPIYQTNGLAPIVADALPEKNLKDAEADTGRLTPEPIYDPQNPPLPDSTLMNGLLFDFKGKKFDPAMFPVILDENNNILLDMRKIYDPAKGNFPKIVSASKDLVNAVNFKEGKQVIEVLESLNGQIKINNGKLLNKVNWGKVGKVASTVGKLVMTLLLL